MKKELKILMVDDHPVIIEAYKNILALSDLNEQYNFIIDSTNNCDDAIKKINISAKSVHFDVIFLDVKLPPSSDGEIISGEDLALYSKKRLPKAKIMMLTMFNEGFRIQNILKTVNPDGLLIKDDLTSKELTNALSTIMNTPPYYSATVTNYLRKQAVNLGDTSFDDVDRKILFYLSKGVKTKNLIKYVELSLSAIEKRKASIKDALSLSGRSDLDLVKLAEKRGLI